MDELVCSYASHLHADLRGRNSLGAQSAWSGIGQDVLQHLPIVLDTLAMRLPTRACMSSGARELEILKQTSVHTCYDPAMQSA